jgi:CRISPR-associated endonuclease/helicase Cas3
MLPDIRIAKEKAERVMDEYKRNPSDFENNLISPKAMELFYQYYFFDRANQMDYPLRREQIGREDSMFSLLSTNTLSVQAYKRTNRKSPPLCLRQSFKTAAESFAAINASTEGVIVPYGKEGKSIIANLCSTSCNLRERLDLVKHAQRYSVNLFPNVFRALCDKEAIKEVQPGSGIMYLDSQYYSQDFGISLESVEGMPFLNA